MIDLALKISEKLCWLIRNNSSIVSCIEETVNSLARPTWAEMAARNRYARFVVGQTVAVSLHCYDY